MICNQERLLKNEFKRNKKNITRTIGNKVVFLRICDRILFYRKTHDA